jgi:hypothetical protein
MLFSINNDLINPKPAHDTTGVVRAQGFISVTEQLNNLGDVVFRYDDVQTRSLYDTLVSPESPWQLAAYDAMYIRTGKGSRASHFLRLAAQFEAAGIKAPSVLGLDTYICLGEMSRQLRALRRLDGNPFVGMSPEGQSPDDLLRQTVSADLAKDLNLLGFAKILHAIALCESGVLDQSDTAAEGVLATVLRPEDFWVTQKQLLNWTSEWHKSQLGQWWENFTTSTDFPTVATNAISFFTGFRYGGQAYYGYTSPQRIGLTSSDVRTAISRLYDLIEQEKRAQRMARLKAQNLSSWERPEREPSNRQLAQKLYQTLRNFETGRD